MYKSLYWCFKNYLASYELQEFKYLTINITKTSYMTTLAGGFLVTNYHDAGRNVSKSSLDRGRKQKRPIRPTAVDAWRG